MTKLPAEADLLFDLLRWEGEPRPSPTELGALGPAAWEALADLALRQGVAPLLRRALRQRDIEHLAPAATVARLEATYRASALRAMGVHRDLAQIVAGATAQGIPLVVLKGAALAAPVYRDVALRPMGDIDLLAPEPQVAALGAQLAAAGYRPIRSAQLGASLPLHLPTLERPGGACPVELHWRLSTAEDTFQIPVEELWARAEPLELPGCRALGLAAEDLLLHLCVHATYQHELIGVGLRPLCDIAQLLGARGAALDWGAVGERAGRWRCLRGLGLALRLAHDLVGAPVPAHALAAPGAAPPAGLIDAARVQLFTAYAEGLAMPAPLAQLAASQGAAARLRTIWGRIFVRREALARQFQVSAGGPRIYAYYLARLWALLRRHAPATAALALGDGQARASAARRSRIAAWLAEG